MKKQESWHGLAHYEIEVNGCFGSHWSDWFEGMEVQAQGSVTTLIGQISDQAALHGLLMRIRDLNLVFDFRQAHWNALIKIKNRVQYERIKSKE